MRPDARGQQFGARHEVVAGLTAAAFDPARHGFDVTRVPLAPVTTPYNLRYLTAKRDRMGHDITIPNGSRLLPRDTFPAVGE